MTALAGAFLGCGFARSNEPQEPMDQPEFLTPVAEAQAAGVKLYWLGDAFKAGSLVYEINAGSDVISRTHIPPPGGQLAYWAHLEKGTTGMNVQSYVKGSHEADAVREAAAGVPGFSYRRVQVGPWKGQLYTLPGGSRPVNQLWLFVDVGDSIVVGQASSGTSGIPGEDVDPLIQSDVLIFVMEQLRPYPQ